MMPKGITLMSEGRTITALNIHYRHTPRQIRETLELFTQHNLNYLLFKCEHIFAGENKNLDILFASDTHYLQAAVLLRAEGFICRLSEKVEKYKQMYVRLPSSQNHQDLPCSIHLHREVAWHGMIALDKQKLFQRKKMVASLITIPSLEDSILIHAAHVLFENFQRGSREKPFLEKMIENVDRDYLESQIKRYHWKAGFWRVVNDPTPLTLREIFRYWLAKLLWEPETAAYGVQKAIAAVWRRLDVRRTGALISLIGVNGTGKTTLAKKLLQATEPWTKHLGVGQKYYYFGWKPTFPLTRLVSFIQKKRKKKIFEELIQPIREPAWSFRQELLFIAQYVEYLYRYLMDVYPFLRKGQVVVTDRYFYDIYGQYPPALQSKVLPVLLRIFPAPDKTFLLLAPLAALQTRMKANREGMGGESERIVLPEHYLQQQQQNYQHLQELFSNRFYSNKLFSNKLFSNIKAISTEGKPSETVSLMAGEIAGIMVKDDGIKKDKIKKDKNNENKMGGMANGS